MTAKRIAAEREAEEMASIIRAIARDKKQVGHVRLAAADSRLNRILGKPVQTNINLTADDVAKLSDDELRAELARLGGEAVGSAARSAPEEMPDGPDSVVH